MMKTIDCYCTVGSGVDAEPPAEKLLAEMDEVGVDKAVISPPDRCLAWENEDGNDGSATQVQFAVKYRF